MDRTLTKAGHARLRAGMENAQAHWYWFAVLAGFAFAGLSLSLGYVTGSGPFWQQLAGDAAQGQIGWFYYARDAWRFPLFAMGNYHLPEGSSILLSDGLPLFALPAKLLYGYAWPHGATPPIYTGVWIALCLVLQAVAASRLLSTLEVRGLWAHLAGVVLFCYVPMLFLRFGHATLLAHFFILFALAGYVSAKRHGLPRKQWIMLCALPVVALLVHPYMAAMSALVVFATILDQWRERRIDRRRVLALFGSMVLAGAGVMGLGGFLHTADRNFGDYGLYSLNLLSALTPFPGTLSGRWLGTDHPSIQGIYQWEGGSYLGAGVLFLCAVALPALRGWREGMRRHAVLLGVLAATLVFAVSNRVGFGSHEVLHVELPGAVIAFLSNFRGSGRFVWVAVYALLAALISATVHRYSGRVATVLLLVAATLQVTDVLPMQSSIRAASASATPASIDRAAWQRLIRAHQRVFEFPSFECGSLFGNGVPGTRWRALEIDWIAAQLGKPNNSAYLARATKDCAREREEAARNHGQPGVLYLYRSTDDIGSFLVEHGVDASRCGSFDDVAVCSADMDLSALR